MGHHNRQSRMIICEGCGVTVVTFGTKTKWCKECAEKQRKLYEARHKKKKRAEKPLNHEDASIWFHDSPEDIKKCLECERPKCRNCLDYRYNLAHGKKER